MIETMAGRRAKLMVAGTLLLLVPVVAVGQEAGSGPGTVATRVAEELGGGAAPTPTAGPERSPTPDAGSGRSAPADGASGAGKAEVPHTLGEALGRIAPGVAGIWTFEVFTVEDRPVSVGHLVVALLVLLVGVPVVRFASKLLGRRVYPRFGLDRGAAAAFATITRYLLLVLVLIFAMWVSGIPLTVFTLAGGALAIGIGFGSQNIANNFISGLVLLAERPIKVGDLVEVEGTYGEVERIGARSTRIRTFDNTHIIMPNAMFLENPVVNWTLSDRRVRVTLTVGVVYGAPTRRVAELLRQAMKEHDNVLPTPEPLVFFADFGDSALVFESLFWIVVNRFQDRRRVLSDLRYRVDEMFREEGIVIAFPQRDVHLDTSRALDIRLVDSSTPSDDG
jgi:small-conductance mechanosensitive channel